MNCLSPLDLAEIAILSNRHDALIESYGYFTNKSEALGSFDRGYDQPRK